MKKIFLFLLCFVCVLGYTYGQETISESKLFADRSINGSQKKNTGETPVRIGKYAEEYRMFPGETLQEAVTKSSLLSPTMGKDDLPVSFATTAYWGTVYGLDLKNGIPESVFYTKELTIVDTYYYSHVKFTFYNSKFEKLHEISFDLPNKCNDAKVLEHFSGAFWDNNAGTGWEYVFMVHYFDEPGGPTNQRYDNYVYTTKDGGSRLATLSGVSGLSQYFNSSIANNSFIIADKWLGNTSEEVKLEAYKSRTYAANMENPIVIAEYDFNLYTTLNFDGAFFDTRTIDGVDYYYFAHYELPYYSERNPNWIVEETNTFIVDFYKSSDLTLAKTIEIPIVQKDIAIPIEACFGMAFREFDVTSKVFNDDDQWEFIFAKNQYVTAADAYFPIYCLINEDGEVLKELPFMIDRAIKLTDLDNYETQYAITHNSGAGIVAISFFDLPSWEIKSTFNARHNGELLSLSFNRYPIDDKYVYIFALGEGSEENGRKFNKINWYNPDGSLYKDHRIYMEGNDYFFEAMVGASTLNPYLFNNDEKMEYIGFCGTTIEGNNTLISARIYDEDSNLLFSAADDGARKIGAGLYTASNGKNWEYFITMYTTNTAAGAFREYSFHPLPLTSFTEGDGTRENPYLIKTAGDFDQIRINPSAAYIMDKDIDMATLLAVKYSSGWTPIPFSGILDAKGHTITGFKAVQSTESFFGLFGEVKAGTIAAEYGIKNLKIKDAELIIKSNNRVSGILAGRLAAGNAQELAIVLDNIHITGKITDGGTMYATSNIGGIAGEASYHTNIKNSSFVGSIETALPYGNSSIGGVLGKASNFISVSSTYSKGKIDLTDTTANNRGNAGGIVGNFGQKCTMKDCYSTMDVLATNNAGGVIGYFNTGQEKGTIENCYATGTIKASYDSNTYAGSIIGSTDENNRFLSGNYPEQSILKTKVNQQGLVALSPKVTAIKGHRVAGEGQGSPNLLTDWGVLTLDSIKNVYAIADMLVGLDGSEAVVTSTDNESIDGANITANELTQAFYQGIGWQFGRETATPWIWNEDGKPRLYTEFAVNGITLNITEALIDVDETTQLTVSLSPVDVFNSNVTWASSDDEVATVVDGLITGLKYGTAIVTVTSEDGGYTAKCEVNVGRTKSISIDKDELILVAGKDETLNVSFNPEDVTYKKLSWASSNKNIAIVDANGRVTAIAVGECTITATLKGTEISGDCKVIVKAANSISLNKTTLELNIGSKETLVASIDPSDSPYQDLTWESSNNAVASVNAFGQITAISKGECTIKVSLNDTDLFDTCVLTVKSGESIDNANDKSLSITLVDKNIEIKSDNILDEIRIYNTNGKLVYMTKASYQATIPVSAWSAGIYVVKTISETNSSTHKLIVK
ncbi:Ig-like domain-containing protein [Bacteroidales bacterium OttesenSCG-928-I14]|nr:Ig-like domain-containing protein [Bacteroidales bacterium OttesenSCG-928-I14]